MYLYYDKNLNLRTKIDHGEKIRQGSDFEIVLCLDNDFDFETNLNSITATIKYNGNKIGNDVISQSDDLEVFAKLYPNENTVDLIDGVYYWMYHFKFDKDPYTLNAGQITFNPTLTYVDNNNVVYKTLTFGSADLFVEKTIGFGKQNINLTNNFYKDIKEQLQILEAKKANKVDMSDEEIIVIDGKPVLVSQEFIDLVNNEQLGENLDKINQLFEEISNKPTDLRVEILGENSVSYRSLKNTKWTFNDVINFESFVKTMNLTFVSNFEGFSSINVAVAAEDAFVLLYDKTEVYARIVGQSSFWTNTIYKNIEIIGGEDVENVEVIAWFENNAICTSTPNDSIKYSLVLTGDTLTLSGTDGTRSSVTLNYANKNKFNDLVNIAFENSTDISDLKTRVTKIENEGVESGEGAVSKYVINTVQDLTFVDGKKDVISEGDLLTSLKTVNGNEVTAVNLKVGDVIYNKQLNQPDLWISEIVYPASYILPATISTTEDISDLTGSVWEFKNPFEKDEEQSILNINFVSNGQNFKCIIYDPGEGMQFVNLEGELVTIYNEVANEFLSQYRTITITGGMDVTNKVAIDNLNYFANLVSVGAEIPDEPEVEPEEPNIEGVCAKISLLEAEKVDLEDYLKTTDVVYVDNLAGQLDVDTVGTLTIKGVEHKIKVKKVSGSGTGLTEEQESLLNNLVVESNSGYTAGTQRMIGMVYENTVDSQATKGFLVGLPIPSISFTQKVTSGIEIGTLTINGVNVKIYIPISSGPGVTEERVQEMIDNSLIGVLQGDY